MHEGTPRPAPNICSVVMEHQNFQARDEGSLPSTRFSRFLQDDSQDVADSEPGEQTRFGRFTDAPAAISWVTIAAVLGFALLIWLLTPPDSAIPATSTRAKREAAIRKVFGPYHGAAAVRVARCESGVRPWARNGEYAGLFQMGAAERRRYGHGANTWQQARAARRYFAASGRDWSPWSCKP